MMKRLPTLVTYRSAEELRDAGIRFAYRKAGLFVGLLATLLCVTAAMRLMLSGADDELMFALLAVGVVACGTAFYSGRTMEYPHFPRLSLEELESMRDDMGLPPEVFRQTHDAVLHGTFDEHRAIETTSVVLSKIKQGAQ